MIKMIKSLFKRKKQPYILCAANHYKDGKFHEHQPKNVVSGYVVCGRRHHNIITTVYSAFGVKSYNCIQGFLTSDDRFLTREEAYDLAVETKKIKDFKGATKNLLSEDLW
jgi:hypothetical protein